MAVLATVAVDSLAYRKFSSVLRTRNCSVIRSLPIPIPSGFAARIKTGRVVVQVLLCGLSVEGVVAGRKLIGRGVLCQFVLETAPNSGLEVLSPFVDFI